MREGFRSAAREIVSEARSDGVVVDPTAPTPTAVTRPVVMFSSGRASFVAAVRAAERYEGVRLLFCDTKVEDRDNYRFLRESTDALGLPLMTVQDGRTPWDVAFDEHMIPNNRAKLCSRVLKHQPARAWLDENAPDALIVVGIGWSEQHRLPGIAKGHEPREVWAPLTEPPYLDGEGLNAVIRSYGIEPPRMYAYGYPHANCAGGCFLAGQAHWRNLLIDSPDLFAEHERNEQEFRSRHGDYAILRDRSGGETTPLPLIELRRRIEADQPIDLLDWGGCGCTSGEDDTAPIGVGVVTVDPTAPTPEAPKAAIDAVAAAGHGREGGSTPVRCRGCKQPWPCPDAVAVMVPMKAFTKYICPEDTGGLGHSSHWTGARNPAVASLNDGFCCCGALMIEEPIDDGTRWRVTFEVDQGFGWHPVVNEGSSERDARSQFDGLLRLIDEGELIRNPKLERATTAWSEVTADA